MIKEAKERRSRLLARSSPSVLSTFTAFPLDLAKSRMGGLKTALWLSRPSPTAISAFTRSVDLGLPAHGQEL